MPQQQVQSPRPKNTIGKRLGIISLIVALIIGVSMLTVWATYTLNNKSTQTTAIDGNLRLTSEETDIAQVVAKVSPSVVSIITKQGNLWREKESAGTGVIISADGYVLTNKHVIADASSVRIVTSGGEYYTDVKIVGRDPLNDIAFLKISNVQNLPTAELGTSTTVKVGQKVIAIGNSLGQYQNTVTSGIISGKGRPVSAYTDEDETEYETLNDLLQTDAAINPGNSGGPLLNMSGQVVGINTAMAYEAQNIGFAIPIDGVKGLVKGLLASGEIRRSYIGVRYIDITPEVRAEYKLSTKAGAYVGGHSGSAVESGGPADKAGIKEGDIITKVNDKLVGENGGLSTLVSEFLPGEMVSVTVVRNNKEEKFELVLGAYKS